MTDLEWNALSDEARVAYLQKNSQRLQRGELTDRAEIAAITTRAHQHRDRLEKRVAENAERLAQDERISVALDRVWHDHPDITFGEALAHLRTVDPAEAAVVDAILDRKAARRQAQCLPPIDPKRRCTFDVLYSLVTDSLRERGEFAKQDVLDRAFAQYGDTFRINGTSREMVEYELDALMAQIAS